MRRYGKSDLAKSDRKLQITLAPNFGAKFKDKFEENTLYRANYFCRLRLC